MMGIGIGIDIEDIKRFRSLDRDKNKQFLDKIFTDKELEYCFSKKDPAQHLAVRYSGKEAISKAVYQLKNKAPSYDKVEIFNNSHNVPIVRINDKNFNELSVRISLSHSKDKAIALAIVQKE